MNCPDETAFARLQLGQLPPVEAATLHAHLDVCPACLELASLLGCLGTSPAKDASNFIGHPESTGRTRKRHRAAGVQHDANSVGREVELVSTLTLLIGHAYFASRLGQIGLRCLVFDLTQHSIGVGLWHTAREVFCCYGVLWSSLGLLWGALTLYTLTRQNSPYFRWATYCYACAALPSIVLAPIAICALLAYKARGLGREHSSQQMKWIEMP